MAPPVRMSGAVFRLLFNFMIIDWLKLGAALMLMLVPSALFHATTVRYRPVQREWAGHWRQILSLGLHPIDLGRATLGAWLLLEGVTRDPTARGLVRHLPLLVHAAVLAVAVLVQTVGCRERDALHAPFFFVSGLVFGYFAPVVAGFGILFAVVIAAGLRAPAMYFPLLAVSVAAAGVLFRGKGLALQLAVCGTVVLMPWLLSLLFRRPLMVTYRSRRAGSLHAPISEHSHSNPPIDTTAAGKG